MGWGSLPRSSLPLSTVVIRVGHPLRLVVGIWSCVCHLLSALVVLVWLVDAGDVAVAAG